MMLLLAAVESILLERNVTMFSVGPAMAFFMKKNYYGTDEKCLWHLVVDMHDLSCCLVMVRVLLPCTLFVSILTVFR